MSLPKSPSWVRWAVSVCSAISGTTSPTKTNTIRGPTICRGCTAGRRPGRGAFLPHPIQLARRLWGMRAGKLFFQTFSDFLLGLSAADNLSPFGRSNIQTIQANEGAGPQRRTAVSLPQLLRRGLHSGRCQGELAFDCESGLALGICRARRSTPPAPSATPGRRCCSRLPIPPASGTLVGNTVAANYNPNLINPYTGQPFGAPPAGVLVRSTNSFYQNGAPLDTLRAALRFRLAAARGAAAGWRCAAATAGSTSRPLTARNAAGAPLFTAPPFAQGFTNADSSNNLSSLAKALPRHHARLRTAHAHFAAFRPHRGPGLRDSAAPAMEHERAVAAVPRTLSLDIGYVGSQGKPSADRARPEPAAAGQRGNPVNCGYDGVAADCITTNTAENANLRVPFSARRPPRWPTMSSPARRRITACRRRCASRRRTACRFRRLTRTPAPRTIPRIYNDPNNLSLDWARASFDRTHRFTRTSIISCRLGRAG